MADHFNILGKNINNIKALLQVSKYWFRSKHREN